MFPWNIAKSAEAMFSRWAIKKVCKFLLKKKLGQLILGDIDLNQLDVQLSAGTLQLSDLALNVDYLNQKIGSVASVAIKEGSIGSLLISMPWKGKGCQIEVDELEIVLGPCRGEISQIRPDTSNSSKNCSTHISQDPGTVEHERVDNTGTSASVDVHEGVKAIAKMVKWFLTSFHIKVKKLIVAFDPSIGEEKNKGCCRTLVLRITEVECGTDISEDLNSNLRARVDNFLGLSRLTNFVKFHGAILEFIQIDGDARFPGCCQSNVTTPIVTGAGGGFSGSLKLSIPWKNGSLDIRKVDTDIYVDPIQLRLQPSSIKYFLYLWGIVRDMGDGKDHIHDKAMESIYYNAAASHSQSSSLDSCVFPSDKMSRDHEISSVDICSPTREETVTDTLLPGSQFISDWVPSSISRNERDRPEEPDFGASVDQFFECFDGLRNSQSTLGNSGIWNWTCSVFSAITAASNLASGSVHIPPEQKHVETNIKATIAGISFLFSFIDEDQVHPNRDNVHYMGAKFHDMVFILKVCSQEMNFEATVENMELSDHFSTGNDVGLYGINGDLERQTALIKRVQAAVHGAFPSVSSSKYDNTDRPRDATCFHSVDRCSCTHNCTSLYSDDVVTVTLLRTTGVSQCQFSIAASGDSYTGTISFSLKLPPFIFWVNFPLIRMALDLFLEIGNSFEMTSTGNVFASEAFASKYGASFKNEAGKRSFPHVTTLSHEKSLRGKIIIPNARVILCFPFEKDGDFRSYSSWDKFIALDFSSSSSLSEEKVPSNYAPHIESYKRSSSTFLRSLHLNMGNLAMYLLTSASKDNVETKSSVMPELTFFAQTILSVTDATDCLSVLSIFWQEGPVTGPWIANRAKRLATSEDLSGRNKSVGKDFEIASVNTVKNMEDFNTNTRQEMILSSEVFMHAHISSVIINLSSSQYYHLHSLLLQAVDWCSFITSDPVGPKEKSSVSQTSILVECDFVEIQVRIQSAENLRSIKNSLQSELPGCWCGLRLQIRKFELLSVSNIGGIRDASFLRLAHDEGSLWGSNTGVPDTEFLLISFSNSSTGRGDGEGSNVLSPRCSGSDIVHFWDPEDSLSHTSITIRSCTIVAVGGRLDWFDTIPSFFNLPSSEFEQTGVKKQESPRIVPCGSSFILNLVDIGLSYEPYLNNMVTGEGFDAESSSTNTIGKMGEHYVACLLAASSLKLSNVTLADSIEREYKIRVKDLGLLCAESGLMDASGTYSVEHLRNLGYVKVAQEAHVEALLRMNCKNGHLWEVECSESHIVLNTCHDTASGMIRLAAQLQQLFAPDVEEAVVHLQNRWNNVQQTQESDITKISNCDSAPTSQMHPSSADAKIKSGVINLMDEICEDAFHFDRNRDGQSDFRQAEIRSVSNDELLREVCSSSTHDPESVSHNFSFTGLVPAGFENNQTPVSPKSFPEFIEGYFLSDLQPLSELSLNHNSYDILKCTASNAKGGEVGRGNNGWYRDSPFKILENHVSKVSHQTSQRLFQGDACMKSDECGTIMGRVLLKNINVKLRLYAGSDWHNLKKDDQPPSILYGRDTTISLELALCGIGCQYDIFRDGEVSVSKLALSIQDFRLNDNSKDAPWKLVLGRYQSKDHPRENSSKALKLDLESVRPHPSIPLEEYRLRIAFLPMRLHLHQCQLDFLISFFGEKSSSADQSSDSPQGTGEPRTLPRKSTNLGGPSVTEEAMLPYFQKFDIWPVLIRVDYSPSRVDLAALRGGKYVELVNLVPWKGVELQLKHVQAVGVYGWSCICESIIGEWLEDISQNQIHKLLKGLPPIRSLVAVGSGTAKLVSLPVKNYRKDHRLVKGMQRGTIAFLRSISLEAIGLGVHLAAGAHDILLQAEYILTSAPPSVPWPSHNRVNTAVRSNQPKDAKQGMQQAYDSISDGLGKSASALVQAPLKRYQRGAGVGSALATAVQAAPAAAIAPASAAARAVHCALLGVRNSLDPERKKESMDKYLGRTHSREFK